MIENLNTTKRVSFMVSSRTKPTIESVEKVKRFSPRFAHDQLFI